VTVTADRMFLSGDTGIFADGFDIEPAVLLIGGEPFPGGEPFEGEAGNITVTAGNLEVRNGAEISASFFGFGQGG
jgi:large exoprotein involved in heme utilization and adhesion